jgi:DNA-3-methyladenine glycosylase
MNRMLPKAFFNRKTEIVARELLGKSLVRNIDDVLTSYVITEAEAYIGPHDLASHSSKGRTARTEIMYMDAGTLYVYFVYGMHYMLNIITEEKEYPAAILIRGVEGISGPGRVAKHLKIDKRLNGSPLSKKTGLWIEDRGLVITPRDILKTPRIGVAYAGDVWANKKLRFVLQPFPHKKDKK